MVFDKNAQLRAKLKEIEQDLYKIHTEEFYYNNEVSKEALILCRLVAKLGKNLGTEWDEE